MHANIHLLHISCVGYVNFGCFKPLMRVFFSILYTVIGTKHKIAMQQQLSTLSEGDLVPAEGTSTSDLNRISSKGNSSLPVQAGRNEVLLGDPTLRQENR